MGQRAVDMPARTERTPRNLSKMRRFVPVVLLALALAAAYLAGLHELVTLEKVAESRLWLKQLVEAHPFASPLVFAAVYATAVAVSLPIATAMTIAGGFLFGWALASILVAIAATAGASVIFLAVRAAFGPALRRRLDGRIARLADGFERNAFSYLLALRLAPVLPFFLLNVAPAFFRVRLPVFVAATFIGILPAVIAYSWLGQGLESVVVAAEAAGRTVGPGDLVTPEILIAIGLLALVAALAAIVRSRRGA